MLKNKKRNLFKLKQLVHGHTRYGVLLFVVMVLAAVAEAFGLSLVLPLLSGLVGVEGNSADFLKYADFLLSPIPSAYRIEALLFALVVVFLCKSVLMILHHGMAINFAMHLREKWSEKIFSKYLHAKYTDILSQKQGALINNIIIEPLRASKSITMFLELLSKLLLSVTLFSMLLLTDWRITLLAALGGGAVLYFLRNTTHRYSVKFGRERLTLNQLTTAVAAEGISAIREIKIFGIGDRFLSSLAGKLARYTKIHTKFAILSDIPGHFIEFVIIFFIAIVLICIRMIGKAELKEVLPFIGFFVLVCQRLLVYVSFIISHRMKISSFFPSLNLIHTLIYEEKSQEDRSQRLELDELKHDVVLKDITFSYGDGKPVLPNLNLTIQKGKITAIVGPSGIGKSTIADLILRLFEPQKGKILVNGQEISQFDLFSWRSKIGYVSQEPFIFNTSVKQNILIGKPSADMDEVIQAAKMANIHDFIMTWADRYDTVVGDRGVKLSAGQRQRLAIARAIIRQPELFIFDEATSSLDGQSEKMIQQSIEKLSRSKTILIIAHRISTLENADIIYTLEDGGRVGIKRFESLQGNH